MFGVPYFLTNPFESPWIEPPWFCLRAGPPGGNTFTLAGNKKNQWFGPMSEAGLVGVGRIPQLYTNVSFFLRTLGLWLHLAVPSPSRPSRLFMIGKPGNRWRRINSAQVSSIVEINMVKVMSKCTKPFYRCSMVQRGAWWCSQRFHEGIAPSVKALEHIWANHKAPRRSSQGKAQFWVFRVWQGSPIRPILFGSLLTKPEICWAFDNNDAFFAHVLDSNSQLFLVFVNLGHPGKCPSCFPLSLGEQN